MPTEIEVLKRYQRGKAATFSGQIFFDLVNHEWFLYVFMANFLGTYCSFPSFFVFQVFLVDFFFERLEVTPGGAAWIQTFVC